MSSHPVLSAQQLASDYEQLVSRAGVDAPWLERRPGDPEYDQWADYLEEQARIDGLKVEFTNTLQISYFQSIALLAALSGERYDLPRTVR